MTELEVWISLSIFVNVLFLIYFFLFLNKELIILSPFIREKMLVDMLQFCWDYGSFLKINCLHTCLMSNSKYKLHLHIYKIRCKLHLHIYKSKVKAATCCIFSNEIYREKKCLTILTVYTSFNFWNPNYYSFIPSLLSQIPHGFIITLGEYLLFLRAKCE